MKPSAQDFDSLQQAIGYRFADKSLLRLALRHKSCGKPNNERLEFLGDAILDAVVAEALYLASDSVAEGNMTVARSRLVNGTTLAEFGRQLALDKLVELGRGERRGGKVKSSIVEDAFEALVGAIFLDSNFDTAREVLQAIIQPRLAGIMEIENSKDAKTELQELLQAHKAALPEYELLETEGPDHRRSFTVSCRVDLHSDETQATASTRKKAEQLAARAMIERLAKADLEGLW